MKKLFCSKISHNPYKEEMITEIIERVFQIDGYCVEEKIEGVLFDIHFDDEQVTSIKISNTNMRKYFEDNFNKERFFNKIKELGANFNLVPATAKNVILKNKKGK